MLPELKNQSWQENINGPWLVQADLEPYLSKWSDYEDFELEKFGESEEKRPLYAVKWGKGKIKIVLWSQMHGNEATATLSIIDIIEFFHHRFIENDEELKELSTTISIVFIPMLNPDGAQLFTRRNARLVDMNRDAIKQQSSEMRAFFELINRLNPDWAFNLHDQRTIFSVGSHRNCATLSYLAPSPDFARSKSKSRIKTMQLIAGMHQKTESLLSGHFGKYSDEFYPRAVGDNLMAANIPCVLLEAGTFPNDPKRTRARQLIFHNLIHAFSLISDGSYLRYSIEEYDAIPENEQLLRDMVFRDVNYHGQICDIALQEQQVVIAGQWHSHYILDDLGDLSHLKGIKEYQGGEIELNAPLMLQGKVNLQYSNQALKILMTEGRIS
tara:strand:- start:45157 stop:46308 length:1152 start_codon:yes stop_codon:yes gene_type:complete